MALRKGSLLWIRMVLEFFGEVISLKWKHGGIRKSQANGPAEAASGRRKPLPRPPEWGSPPGIGKTACWPLQGSFLVKEQPDLT